MDTAGTGMSETGERKGKMERTREKETTESGDIRVSVVMPVLNGMPYFKTALGSVASQTMRELEILVVDAGSTDGTVEYVREMQESDARIRLFHSDIRNSGYQRNFGIREAHGEYIGFCDADDYLELSMFEELYRVAEEADKPDTVKGDYYMFVTRETGEELSLYYHIFPPDKRSFYGKTFSFRNYPVLLERDGKLWNGIFRRNFLLDNKIKLNEIPGGAFSDFGFVWQVNMLAEKQWILEKAFYHYRRDNERSSVYKKDAMCYILKECRSMLEFLEEHPEEKNIFFPYILQTMLEFIGGRYRRDCYVGVDTEHEEDMESFRRYLCTVIRSSTDIQKSQLWRMNDLQIFLNGGESFRRIILENYKALQENRRCFYDYMRRWKEAVIFGAGEMGSSVAAFLAANEYEGTLIFCDNDFGVQDTELMGCPVMSPERAALEYSDAVYCIPNFKYYLDMKKQLCQLGIHADRIIMTPDIGLYASLGLEYKIIERNDISV